MTSTLATTTIRTTLEPTPAAVTGRFLAAVTRRDFAEVAATLSSDVWLRAMLVREVHEATDAAGAVTALQGWFAAAEEFEVHELEQAGIEGRQRVRWQFVLRPDWAPDTPHRIEQVGYVAVRDGKITRLDLVCTGFHPLV